MGEQEEGELNACQTITFGPNEAYTNAASSEYLRTVYVCVFEREIHWLLSVSTHQTCRPPNRSSHPALNSCLTLSVCMCLHAHSECWFVLIKSHGFKLWSALMFVVLHCKHVSNDLLGCL